MKEMIVEREHEKMSVGQVAADLARQLLEALEENKRLKEENEELKEEIREWEEWEAANESAGD